LESLEIIIIFVVLFILEKLYTMKKSLLLVGIVLLSLTGNSLYSQTTFNYTGSMDTYIVPVGINAITIECWGAEGNIGLGLAGGSAGLGGYSKGELAVTPGQVLNIYVGGQNGYNGGGIGGNIGAGNGGGASDVRTGGITLGDRVIVAGGGGGGGATGCQNDLAAGNGGYGGGGAGTDGTSSSSGAGGIGGALGIGGGAGLGCPSFLGTPGLDDGTGGDGQGCCCSTTPGGGGGGGGYVNGGGGGGGSAGTPACSGNDKGGGAGGAGGSSWIGTLANTTITDGIQSGEGVIVISEICSITGIDTKTECNSYTWIDGINYTASNNTATFNIVGGAVSGCDSIVTLDLTINNVSDLTTTISGITITANNTTATYQWLDCNSSYSIISGENGQSFTATVNGNYAVEFTENSCVDTSSCVAITTVGVFEHNFGETFKIYPNPTDGSFTINSESEHDNFTITVTDVLGNVVNSKKYTNQSSVNMNIEVVSGIYFVRIQNQKGADQIIKLIKE